MALRERIDEAELTKQGTYLRAGLLSAIAPWMRRVPLRIRDRQSGQ